VRFRIGVILLCALLTIAGTVHLLDPEVFLPALPEVLPFRLLIIYLTGIIELLFVPFFFTKYRSLSLGLVKWYFAFLLPAHIYISLYGIPMFGVTNHYVLWGRTFLQLPLTL
jgi:uncharacterized membrane protein